MRLRPYATVAALAAVSLLGATACTAPAPKPGPSASASGPGAGSGASETAEVPVGGDVGAYQTLAAALTATMGQNSYRLEIDSTDVDMVVDIDYRARLMRMTAKGTADGEKLDAEIRAIGQDVYLMYRSGDLAAANDGMWIKMGAADMSGEDVFAINSLFDPAKLLNAGTPVTSAGDGKYQVTPTDDVLELPSLFVDMIDGGGTGFEPKSMLVTVGADGNVASMEVTGADGKKATISASDFGKSVAVDKPADSEVLGE